MIDNELKKEKIVGCHACLNICPQVVSMESDSEGFGIPLLIIIMHRM